MKTFFTVLLVSLMGMGAFAKKVERKGDRKTTSFQTPIQQSANVVQAVLDAVVADAGLEMSRLIKIQANNNGNGAKVQLLDEKGKCLAIPYEVSFDAMGLPSAAPNKSAIAVCD